MYAWINGEAWAADGQPALTEEHSALVDQESGEVYGLVLSDAEDVVVRVALYKHRHQAEQLELDL